MFKFRIDLAEEAAKTLRANFLEANLKAVIFIAGPTLPLSDSLTFSILHPPSSLLSTHPSALSRSHVHRFQQPRTFLSQFIEQVKSCSNKVCCIFTCHSLHLLKAALVCSECLQTKRPVRLLVWLWGAYTHHQQHCYYCLSTVEFTGLFSPCRWGWVNTNALLQTFVGRSWSVTAVAGF